MAEAIQPLTSRLQEIFHDLVSMQNDIKRTIKMKPEVYPVMQDLVIDLETAEEAVDDALKSTINLTQEIDK